LELGWFGGGKSTKLHTGTRTVNVSIPLSVILIMNISLVALKFFIASQIALKQVNSSKNMKIKGNNVIYKKKSSPKTNCSFK
jgi:hypothetical protein